MLICPKCKYEYEYEYEDGVTVCSDCGTQLIEQLEESKENTDCKKADDRKSLKFGNITAQKAISILFYLGILPLFISAILLGKYICYTEKFFKYITYMQDAVQVSTQSEVSNLPLGIFWGSLYFVFSIFIWKIICELLIIIFRCFETYVQKNTHYF